MIDKNTQSEENKYINFRNEQKKIFREGKGGMKSLKMSILCLFSRNEARAKFFAQIDIKHLKFDYFFQHFSGQERFQTPRNPSIDSRDGKI